MLAVRVHGDGIAEPLLASCFEEFTKRRALPAVGLVAKDGCACCLGIFGRTVRRAIVEHDDLRDMLQRTTDHIAHGAGVVENRDDDARLCAIVDAVGVFRLHRSISRSWTSVVKPSSAGSRTPKELQRTVALFRRLRVLLESLARQHTSPGKVAVGVGLGVMLGCSPFLGFQVLLALALSKLFRLNPIAVVLGVQISVPPLTPFVMFATAQLGALLLQGHWLSLGLAGFHGIPAAKLVADLFLDMLVGGILFGGFFAVLLGCACGFGVSRMQRHAVASHGS